MVKLAANLSMMFNELEFLDRFAAAAAAGFSAVEFLFPYAHEPDQIAEQLERNSLQLALFNLPPGDWEAGDRGMAALPARRNDFEQSVSAALRYASVLRPHRLHMMSGLADRTDPQAVATYRENTTHACQRAAEHGLTMVIEPINARDMPGYFLSDFGFAADLVTELGLPNLELQYDIYHRQILHGDIIRSIDALIGMIGHVQISAVPDRHEPGSGELDDGRILRHLDASGYDGFVGLEYRPAGDTLAGLAWRQNLGF
ncbi:TIM barrel protein [Devosia sp. J2-20]|uniref:2-oxo-tetronate isomerase n=1 Tax=Devosia sp. J2-20 TaxID=3026161 RepID=UPI00249C527C|nr:2-oxo-tetronate isomerase [Devosia sp. J2-20]WDQ98606.1 TIM barrel protein [Devosia sp. J2-20]